MIIDKPEMAVAVTEFWMLHGFRPLEQIAEMFRKIPELRAIMPDFSLKSSHGQKLLSGPPSDCSRPLPHSNDDATGPRGPSAKCPR